MSDTPRTDAKEYYFSNHDSCAGESLVRRADENDVTWDDEFRGDSVPAEFARQLEREIKEWKDKLDGSEITHAATLADLRDCKRELADRAESWRMSSVCRAKEAVIARLEFELAAERALADRLAGCMAHLADYDWFIHGTHSHSVVCSLGPDRVREALAAWKEARHGTV